MTIDRIDPHASFSFIRWAVSQEEFNVHVKDRVIEEIIQHLKTELNKSRNYKYDTVFDKIHYMMQEYASLGARIVLVTERRDFARSATERQLKKDSIPYDELRMRGESSEPLDVQKLTHVEEISRLDNEELVAYFDDVQGLHDFMGDMRLYDTYQVFVKTRFKRNSNNEDGFTFTFYHPHRRSYRQ